MTAAGEIELAQEKNGAREGKRAARNAGKLTLGRVVQAVCSLSCLAFATRALGPEGFGQLILIHTLSLAVAQFARFESWQSVVRFGTPALRDGDPKRLRRVIGFGLLLDLAGIALGVLVYAALIHLLGVWFGLSPELRLVALLYGVAVVAILNAAGAATGLLHLQDRFGPLAVVATMEPVIRLAGAAGIFFLGGGLGSFLLLWLLALSVSNVGIIVSAFTILARRGGAWRFRFDRAAWTHPEPGMWRYAWGTQWVGALNVAQDYLPTLATGGVIGAAGAGLLKTARLFSDVLVVSTAKLLVPTLLPEFARLGEAEGRALAARVNRMTLGGFFLVFALLAVFGKELISLIAGAAFVGAYPAMLWLAASGVVAASSFSYETFLTAQGAIRRVVWSNSVAIALYFAALAVLLPVAGVEGVGMAAVMSAVARAAMLRWNTRRARSSSPCARVKTTSTRRRKVGFLFNHDHVHQMPHTSPILAALSDMNPALELHVFVVGSRHADFLRNLLPASVLPRIHWREISALRMARGLGSCVGRAIPFERVGALVRHRRELAGMNALVVPETTSVFLKRLLGRRSPMLIYTQHGAGDRAVGFKSAIRHFDHVLVPGPKIRERMLEAKIVRPGGYSEVGYPKFDAVNWEKPARLFANDNPVVWYNPHCQPALSSWFRDGLKVLEFFRDRPDLNLIFAPHVMLFARRLHLSTNPWRLRWRHAIPQEFFDAPNLRIDTGSAACVDMTYARAADVYLGDVSSQVYEFLHRPRPCIFLNSHGAGWEGDPNYAHWKLGPVIEDVSEIETLLDNLGWHQAIFAERQALAFKATFGRSATGGAARAARAIDDAILAWKGHS